MAADRGAAAPGGAGPCVGPGGERAARAHQHNLFLFLFFLVVVNPTAFHNKSQIINKCVPLMTGLFNSKNWKMLRQFFFFFTFPSRCCLIAISKSRRARGSDGPSAQEDAGIALCNPHRLHSLPGSPAVDVPKISFRGIPASWEAGRSHCKALWGAILWLRE